MTWSLAYQVEAGRGVSYYRAAGDRKRLDTELEYPDTAKLWAHLETNEQIETAIEAAADLCMSDAVSGFTGRLQVELTGHANTGHKIPTEELGSPGFINVHVVQLRDE